MDIGFKQWIIRYRQRNSRRGDLAYDIYYDYRFPMGSDKAILLNYFTWVRRADPDAISALLEAYRAYQCYMKYHFDEKLVKENKRLLAENILLQEKIREQNLNMEE